MKNLKLISMILVSLLIVTVSTVVFADDNNTTNDDIWSEPTNAEANSTENTDGTWNDLSNSETNSDTFNNTQNEENNTDDISNYTTKNTEKLADTGLGNSAGIVAIISVLAIVVAIYSAKKINDYNNL